MAVGREVMAYDVVVVGAGPAGLAAAIRLRQLNGALSVCVLEKGVEVGAHLLSGACFDPRALDELLPDWQARGAPLHTPVRDDGLLLLDARRAYRLPLPPRLRNRGCHLISLGQLCRWLAREAEALGVDVFPGFAAARVLYDADGAVKGVATGDMGVGRDGKPKANYQPGLELHGRQTLLAEGCRGSLTREVFERFDLGRDAQPQTYALGLKEVWEVDPALHEPGRVVHGIGWPLPADTYGGSFLYHLDHRQVAVGLIVGLDYRNPWLSPFDEFQRLKTHPVLRDLFAGGRRIAYGARTLVEGGLQSLPRLTFPGGLLAGDCAGFLDVSRLKGCHTAMKSGMLAAEAVCAHLEAAVAGKEVLTYPERLRASWLWQELHRARNIRPGFRRGLWSGLALAALDTLLFRGRAPWTLGHRADHLALEDLSRHAPIAYPRPDGVLTFDRLASLQLAHVHHEADQPCHLQLRDESVPLTVNLARYGAPETRYCPAGVYEILPEADAPRLRINAANCLHCKACDIKDPTQNIRWTVPEGGDGPRYGAM